MQQVSKSKIEMQKDLDIQEEKLRSHLKGIIDKTKVEQLYMSQILLPEVFSWIRETNKFMQRSFLIRYDIKSTP